MNILEKEIEDLIWESPIDSLRKRGLWIHPDTCYKARQVDIGGYGRADIIYVALSKHKKYGRSLFINVVEIKKDLITVDALLQAARYCKGIKRYIEVCLNGLEYVNVDFNITLIGKDIDIKTDFCYLSDFIQGLSVFSVKLDLENGIRFENESGYYSASSEPIYFDIDTLKIILGNQKIKPLEKV